MISSISFFCHGRSCTFASCLSSTLCFLLVFLSCAVVPVFGLQSAAQRQAPQQRQHPQQQQLEQSLDTTSPTSHSRFLAVSQVTTLRNLDFSVPVMATGSTGYAYSSAATAANFVWRMNTISGVSNGCASGFTSSNPCPPSGNPQVAFMQQCKAGMVCIEQNGTFPAAVYTVGVSVCNRVLGCCQMAARMQLKTTAGAIVAQVDLNPASTQYRNFVTPPFYIGNQTELTLQFVGTVSTLSPLDQTLFLDAVVIKQVPSCAPAPSNSSAAIRTSATTWQSSCLAGYAGSVTVQTSNSSALPCTIIGSPACEPCQAGAYSTNNQTACTECPVGRYADASKATACELCPFGQYTNTTGSTECKPCTICKSGQIRACDNATDAVCLPPSPSITPSMSASGTSSAPASVSGTVTITPTATITNSVTVTGTRTATVTPTATTTNSVTVTGTRTSTSTPVPMKVIRTAQWYDVVNGTHVGRISIIGEGLRLNELGAAPMLETNGYVFWNITSVGDSCIEAMLPIWGVYWSNSLVTLRVLESSCTFTKPNIMPNSTLMNLQPSEVPFAGRLILTAPYIGNATTLTVFIQRDTNTRTHCASLFIRSGDSFSCLPTNPSNHAFHVTSSINLHFAYNSGPIHLPPEMAVKLLKPMLQLMPRGGASTRLFARASALLGLSASSSWLQTRREAFANPKSVMMKNTGLVGVLHGYTGSAVFVKAVFGKHMLSCQSTFNLSFLAPTVTSVLPRYVQYTIGIGEVNISLSLKGAALVSKGVVRIQTVSVGGLPCSIRSINASVLTCAFTVSTAFASGLPHNLAEINLPIEVGWGTFTRYAIMSGPTLAIRLWPELYQVFPTLVQPGTLIYITGKNFGGSFNCPSCHDRDVPAMASVGGIPCTRTIVQSDHIASCLVPEVPQDAVGYPRVKLSLINSAGQEALEPVLLSLVGEISVSWDLQPREERCILPSGAAGAAIPFEEPPTLRIVGSGAARCYLIVESAPIRAFAIVGSNSATVEVGLLSSVSDATFSGVGVQAWSNSTGFIHGRCITDQGAQIATNTSLVFRTPTWQLTWEVAPEESEDYLPSDALLAKARFAVLGCQVTSAMAMHIHNLLSCQAFLLDRDAPISALRMPTKSPLLSVSAMVSQQHVNDPTSDWDISFPPIALRTLTLGSGARLESMCTWTPSGESILLTPINFGMANFSVRWSDCSSFPRCSTSSDGMFVSAVPGLPYAITFQFQHDISTDVISTIEPRCNIVVVESSGLRLLSATVVAESLQADDAAWDASISMSGEGGRLLLAVECILWERKIRSQVLRIQSVSLNIVPAGPLPQMVFLATLRFPTAQLPPIHATVLDNEGFSVSATECTMFAHTDGVRAVSPQDITAPIELVPDHGILNITGVALIAEVPVSSDREISLAVACNIAASEAYAELRWRAGVLGVQAQTLSAPILYTDESGLVPAVILQLQPAPLTLFSTAAWTQSLSMLAFRSSISCYCFASGAVAGDPAFLYRAQATPNELGTVILDQMSLVGRRGAEHNISISCTFDWINLFPPIYHVVHVFPCPEGTEPVGIGCDACPPNSFSRGMYADKCTLCPAIGVSCIGGKLTVLPGFYRPPEYAHQPFGPQTELHVCANAEACVVNRTSLQYSCSTGYTGPLCGVCDTSQRYGAFGRYCVKCWPNAASSALLSALIVGFVGLLAFIGFRKNSAAKRSRTSILIRLTMGYVQALASISSLKASVAANYDSLSSWSDSLSQSPFSSGPAQCLLQLSLWQQYLTLVLIPIVAFAGVVVIVAMVFLWRARVPRTLAWDGHLFMRKFREWRTHQRHISALVFFSFVMYMPIVSLSIKVLACTERPIAGVYRVRVNLADECGNFEHFSLRVVAITVLLIYGLGFPLVLLLILNGASPLKKDARVVHALSFIYSGYKTGNENAKHTKQLIWWESVVLIRKAGLIMISELVTNAFLQVVGSVLWLATFLAIQQHYQPYINQLFNILETCGLLILFITAAVASLVLKVALADPAAGPGVIVENELTVTTTMVVITNVLFAVTLLALMIWTYIQDTVSTRAMALVQHVPPSNIVKTAFWEAARARHSTSKMAIRNNDIVDFTHPQHSRLQKRRWQVNSLGDASYAGVSEEKSFVRFPTREARRPTVWSTFN